MSLVHLKSMKWLCAVFLLAIFCAAPTPGFAIETGEKAPDFKLQSLQGEEVSLADLRGAWFCSSWQRPGVQPVNTCQPK